MEDQIKNKKIFNIPVYDDFFVGREKLLKEIENKLLNFNEKFSVQALVGLGGIGKSSIARKYALDNMEQYNLIWWFNAEDKSGLRAEYIQLAQTLNINIVDKDDINFMRCSIDIKLSEINKCLFIFDNVEYYEDIKEYLCIQSKVLVTSRNRKLKGLRSQNIIEIDVFDENEAIEFVFKRLNLESIAQNYNLANELVKVLDYLPLALEQSVSYIDSDPSMNLTDYLKLYEKYIEGGNIYSYFDDHDIPANYHHKITLTWRITMDKINDKNDKVLPFMYICSMLSPEEIPYSLFEKNYNYLERNFIFTNNKEETVKSTIKDIFINFLYKYSIVQWNKENSTIRMHRLMQYIILRDIKSKGLFEVFQKHLIILLDSCFYFNEEEKTSWIFCKSIYPHIKHMLKFESINKDELLMHYYSSIYHKLSKYADYLLSTHDAKSYLLKAIEIDEKIFPNHDLVREVNLNNLGNIMEKLGEYDCAKDILEECLKLNRKNHNYYHDSIATTLNNIGLIELNTKCYDEAKVKFKEALEIDEKLFGEYSQDVFTDLNNLGLTEIKLENYRLAKEIFERAINIGKVCFNTYSPKMATVYKNLAAVLIKLGDNKGASFNLYESVKILEQLYEQNDIKVANELLLLAETIHSFDIETAAKKYEEAFKIAENLYKSNNKVNSEQILSFMEPLGTVYLELQRYEEAKMIFIKAYTVVETYFIDDVDMVINYLRCLSKASFELKEFDDCILKYEKILLFTEKLNIDNTSDLIEDIGVLARLYLEVNNNVKAIEQYNKLIKIHESLKPIDYKSILNCLNISSALLLETGESDESLKQREVALALSCKLNGDLSPKNCIHLSYIGYINKLKGNIKEAKINYEKAINIFENNIEYSSEIDITDVYLGLGDLLIDEENFDDARLNYEKALNINLNNEEYMHGIIKCYEALAKLETVQKNIDEVVKIYKEICIIHERIYGRISEEVLFDINIIIGALIKTKRLRDSIPYIEERAAILEIMYGNQNIEYKNMNELLLKIKEKLNNKDEEKNKLDKNYISKTQAKKLSETYKILIITATDLETEHLFKKLKPLQNEKKFLIATIGTHTYTIAMMGNFPVIHVQTEPGTTMSGASTITTKESIEFWNPKVIIMVGIAFGINNEKQKIGDVLVSKHVVPYEIEKISQDKIGNKITVRRNSIVEAGNTLFDRFKNIRSWTYKLDSGKYSQVLTGQLLSGEKLINNSEFKNQLVNQYPEAIGGEMEATGVYVGARSCNFNEWIVVKGICDWADGNKDIEKDKNQVEAINAAVDLCKTVLENPYTFEELEIKPISEL